jgi:hypothetical protein
LGAREASRQSTVLRPIEVRLALLLGGERESTVLRPIEVRLALLLGGERESTVLRPIEVRLAHVSQGGGAVVRNVAVDEGAAAGMKLRTAVHPAVSLPT